MTTEYNNHIRGLGLDLGNVILLLQLYNIIK